MNTSTSQNQELSMSYRLVQKKFFCHVCQQDFRKMSPVIDLTEIECPTCNQTFCEEISNASEA